MELPADAEAKAKKFKELPADRRTGILEHLAATPEADGGKVVEQIIANGGPEGRFVATVLGKPLPGAKDAPQNKSQGPVSTL